jgi:hypothetical protein
MSIRMKSRRRASSPFATPGAVPRRVAKKRLILLSG